jgi:hypothetical protein
MKRIIFMSLLLVAVFASMAYSQPTKVPYVPASVTLNNTTYTQITSATQAVTISLQCRTAADVLLATSSSPAGTAYFTLKSGTNISIDLTEGSTLWAKSDSCTALEVMYLRGF